MIRDDVFVRLISMPTTISGFVRENPDQTYTIMLNDKMDFETQRECYAHEVRHIENRDLESSENVDVIELRNKRKGEIAIWDC